MVNVQLLLQIFLILLVASITVSVVYFIIILRTIHKAIKGVIHMLEHAANPMNYVTTIIATLATAMSTFKHVKNSKDGEI